MRQLLKMVIPMIGWPGIVKYFCLGILSGLTSFLFVNTVSRVISIYSTGTYNTISKEYLLWFALIILLFVWTKRSLAMYSINITQKISWRLRKEIILLTLKADCMQLTAKRTQIQSALFSDVGSLTGASMSVIDFFTGVIMTLSCLVYMATISVTLFFITIVVAGIGILIYVYTSKENINAFEKGRDLETDFHSSFNSIMNGFKEIFMEPKKGRHIYDTSIVPIAKKSFKYSLTAFTGFANTQMIGQVMFYLLITSVLLVFSLILKIKPAELIGFVFTLTFLLGSVETIMVLLPSLMRSGVAANRLIGLKEDLENQHFNNPILTKYILRNTFQLLELVGLKFSFSGKHEAFTIGPISITVLKGEIIFLYGGNGSGKTTLINSIIGVYLPEEGSIKVNDELIGQENHSDYKSMFSVVFSDFYLFDELMGIENIDNKKVLQYLKLFELEKVVKFENNRFSTKDLSTGQRKRLALIASLVEDKPILVLDEWAADQDPYFRKKFYNQILPQLKNVGKTVIAITHDDQYYHSADRLFKMADGKIYEEHFTKTP